MQYRKKYKNLISLHAKLLFKNKINIVLVAAFVLAGLYGLYQGFSFKQKQVHTINRLVLEKNGIVQNLKSGFKADTLTEKGKMAYKAAKDIFTVSWKIDLPVYKYPASTAVYNIGQGDVFSYYYSFKVESFIMQLFKQTEISNPLRSLAGHFDVTFWIIYLLPLFVLLLCFNILSAELDNGNWRLIYSQGITAKQWVRSKILLVLAILLVCLFVIAIAGAGINYIYFNQFPRLTDALFFTGAILYLLLWMAVFYFINSFGKNTSVNALTGGLIWICVCMLLPIIVSKTAEISTPVDNNIISTYSRRPQNPKIETDNQFAKSLIMAFAQQQPVYHFADTAITDPAFQFRVYHAYHYLLHNERWPLVQQYFANVESRQQITNISTLINPAGSTDGLLANIAGNDAVGNHLFIYQALLFHNELQNTIYPSLFLNKEIQEADYVQLPVFTYHQNAPPKIVFLHFLLLMFITILILAAADKRLERINH